MNDNIKKSPQSPEAALSKRRIQGVEKEVERMNGIIGALQAENEWFVDVNRQLEIGIRKAAQVAEEAAAEATTAAERAEEILQGALKGASTALKGIAPGFPGAVRTVVQALKGRCLWPNIFMFLMLLLAFIATSREYGALHAANHPARRAIYLNSLDKTSLCFQVPSYEFFWEFLVFLGVGVWRWKA
ncbi:hypothetical protein F5Y13DRAFT_152405 [Hypoxylon sp. FL1857]|nr:hypothetical protein F5Y13DRAFT_152405 [Hypoxylon sp. FL1857]